MSTLTSKYILYFIVGIFVGVVIPFKDYDIGVIKNLVLSFLAISIFIYEVLIKNILSRKNDTGRKLYEFEENSSFFRVLGLMFMFALGIYNFYSSSNHIYMNEYTEKSLLQTIIESSIDGKIGLIMYTIMFIFIISIEICRGKKKPKLYERGILDSSGYFLLYEDVNSITIKIFTLEIICEVKVKNNYGKLELKGKVKDIDEIEEILSNKAYHINIKKEAI